MRCFIFIIFLITTIQASQNCYDIVDNEARKWKINGEVYPTWIKAIYRVESNCRQTAIGDLHTEAMSVGAGQIRVQTVHTVAKWYPHIAARIVGLSDYQIVAKLIKDLRFSVLITTHYLKWYMEHGWSLKNATIIYNGWWEVDSKGRAITKDGKKVKNIKYYLKILKGLRCIE